MKHVIGFLGLIWILFLQGCASEALKDYPTREMDRPFTIPKQGLDTSFSVGHLTANDSSATTLSISSIELGLTDRLSLLFRPFPTGLKFTIFSDDTFRLGVSAHYEIVWMGASVDFQTKFSSWNALRLTGAYDYWNILVVKSDTAKMSAFWIFQPGDVFAIGPQFTYSRLRFGLDLGNTSVYRSFRPTDDGIWLAINETQEAIRFVWSLSHVFDLIGTFGVDQFYGEGEVAHGAEGSQGFNLFF